MAALGQQRVRLLDVDLAAEQVRQLAVVVPGAVPLEPPGKRSKSRSGMPSASILSAGVPSSSGTQSPVRKVRSPSMTTPQPAS